MTDTMECPSCGARMVLRTARRGPAAGGQFWGCLNYPRCKQIVNLASDVEPKPVLPPATIANFWVAPIRSDAESVCIQSVAVPRELLSKAHRHLRDERWFRSALTWRCDMWTSAPSSATSTALNLAEDVLLRGRLTACTPRVDQVLGKQFAGLLSTQIGQAFAAPEPLLPADLQCFDSPEERDLYQRLREQHPEWLVTPQVGLDAMVGETGGARRADLLVVYAGEAVVVEIDGIGHANQGAVDGNRDSLLSAARIQTIRATAEQVRCSPNDVIDRIAGILPGSAQPDTGLGSAIRASKTVSSIQVAVVRALSSIADRGSVGIRITSRCDRVELRPTIQTALIEDLNELLGALCSLYDEPAIHLRLARGRGPTDISIGVGDRPKTDGTVTCVVADVAAPGDIAFPPPASKHLAPSATAPDEAALEVVLRFAFGKPSFRPGQLEAVARVARGHDTLVLLPTGGGKSIAFQLSGLVRPGRTIVVSPLVALIDDQVDNLQRSGIDRVGSITSRNVNQRADLLRAFREGEHLFLYVAPERLQTPEFRSALRDLANRAPISAVAIDEVHCVSEWGHDFRPAYLNIAKVLRSHCQHAGITPPVVGLTGTASRSVLRDTQRELGIQDAESIVAPSSFDRAELRFDVVACPSREKQAALMAVLARTARNLGTTVAAMMAQQGDRARCGLVFCQHKDGDFGVERVAQFLTDTYGGSVGRFAGSAPNRLSGAAASAWRATADESFAGFQDSQVTCLVATTALGMGIDKDNVRYTIHYNLPKSPEAFYQEAGRAGRRGDTAFCTIIMSVDDVRRAERLLNDSCTPDEVNSSIDSRLADADDITRLLYFQTVSFLGESKESADVRALLEAVQPIGTQRSVAVPFALLGSDDSPRTEKAIYRLAVIGVINDYMKDYGRRYFEVQLSHCTVEDIEDHLHKYIANYNKVLARTMRLRFHDRIQDGVSVVEAADIASQLLVDFIYSMVERGRRRSILEMWRAAEDGVRDEARLRQRMLQYFDLGVLDEDLKALIDCEDTDLSHAESVLDRAVNPTQASALRSAAARHLASYPDNPWLSLVRGVAETMTAVPVESDSDASLVDCLEASPARWGISAAKVGETFGRLYLVASEESANPFLQRSIRRSLVHIWPTWPNNYRTAFSEGFRSQTAPGHWQVLDAPWEQAGLAALGNLVRELRR